MKEVEETPLISIIVPAYRCEPFIERCIKSLLNQTVESLEIIVINDDSPNGLEETIKNSFRKELDSGKIVYLRNKTNKGQSFSRNRGAKVARGKYLLFADADDVYLPKHVETLYKALTAGKYDVVQVFTKIYVDEHDRVLIHRKYPMVGRTWFILYMLNFQTTYILIEKQRFFDIGGFPKNWNMGEDWYLLTKCLRSGFRLKLIDKPTLLHREHPLAWQTARAREANFKWIDYKNETVLPYLRKLYSAGKVSRGQIATFIFGMIFLTPIWQWPKLFARVLKTDLLFFVKYPESWYYTFLALYKIIRKKLINM